MEQYVVTSTWIDKTNNTLSTTTRIYQNKEEALGDYNESIHYTFMAYTGDILLNIENDEEKIVKLYLYDGRRDDDGTISCHEIEVINSFSKVSD